MVVFVDLMCYIDWEFEVMFSGEEFCLIYVRCLGFYFYFGEIGIGKKEKCDLMGKE